MTWEKLRADVVTIGHGRRKVYLCRCPICGRWPIVETTRADTVRVLRRHILARHKRVKAVRTSPPRKRT